MKRLLVVLVVFAAGLASALVSVPTAAQAKSKTWCDPRSGTSGGVCVTVSKPKFHEKWVDTIPVRNKSKKITVTSSCKWSDSLAVSVSTGVKLSAGAKGSFMGLAEASAGVELQSSITMSASTAREVAGTFKLKPGQSMYCHRTFGYYSFTVVKKEWASNGKIYKTTKTAKVPYTLGALFADH